MITKEDYSDSFSLFKFLMIFVSLVIAFFLVWNFFIKSPTKIIENYEWFHQSYGTHKTYKANIAAAKAQDTNVDQNEKYKMRQELAGLKNMCVANVQAYNARAMQITTRWAQDSSLPQQISVSECE